MESKPEFSIREIKPSDNVQIKNIIINVVSTFNLRNPAFSIMGDLSIHYMYEHYNEPGAAYYIVETAGKVVGGAGIKKLDGADENICELQRMYLLPEARGFGLGRKLLDLCTGKAVEFGYGKIYLESEASMKIAGKMYKNAGFKNIKQPFGNTGHTACNVFMIKDLKT